MPIKSKTSNNKEVNIIMGYKYRIYPNEEQKILFSKHFGHNRKVWNLALNAKQEAWKKDKTNLPVARKNDPTCLQSQLVSWKKTEEFSYLNEVDSLSLLQTLRNLDRAFKNFFAKRARYPKIKNKRSYIQSFSSPQNIHQKGTDKERRTINISDNKKYLNIAKIPNIKIKLHRDLPQNSEIKEMTISQYRDKYFVSFDIIPAKHDIKKNKIIGIDLGTKCFVTTSDKDVNKNREITNNPKYFHKQQRKLKIRQRKLSKKQHSRKKGDNTPKSKNYIKYQLKINKIYEDIVNKRKDHQHKISSRLVYDNQNTTFALEDLNISGMLKNRRLSKSIQNTSWYSFLNMMKYKADITGKNIIKIDRFFPSSKICSNCKTYKEDLKLSNRIYKCSNCNSKIDRDYNAAINIRNEAIRINETVGVGRSNLQI